MLKLIVALIFVYAMLMFYASGATGSPDAFNVAVTVYRQGDPWCVEYSALHSGNSAQVTATTNNQVVVRNLNAVDGMLDFSKLKHQIAADDFSFSVSFVGTLTDGLGTHPLVFNVTYLNASNDCVNPPVTATPTGTATQVPTSVPTVTLTPTTTGTQPTATPTTTGTPPTATPIPGVYDINVNVYTGSAKWCVEYAGQYAGISAKFDAVSNNEMVTTMLSAVNGVVDFNTRHKIEPDDFDLTLDFTGFITTSSGNSPLSFIVVYKNQQNECFTIIPFPKKHSYMPIIRK